MLSAPLSSGTAGGVDTVNVRRCQRRRVCHSRDRRRCGVAFARPSTLRRGIRGNVDVAAWHSWDRRRRGVAFARPSTFEECHSSDCPRSAPNICARLVLSLFLRVDVRSLPVSSAPSRRGLLPAPSVPSAMDKGPLVLHSS